MSRYYKESFFHHQKKRQTHRTKIKKPIDTQSLLNERREPILTFRPGIVEEGEEDLAKIRLLAKSPAAGRQRRPSSSASRRSSVWLPPVDTSGPHLTTQAQPQGIPESKIEERKRSIAFQTVETQQQEEEQPVEQVQPKYKFNEVKFASTSILSNLSRRLETVPSCSELHLPESLVDNLIVDFYQLVVDTIVDKREWQTDCYLDYKPNEKPYLTSEPQEGDPIKLRLESSPNRLVTKEQPKKNLIKKRDMADKKLIPERPQTAKSTMSCMSIKSDVSNISDVTEYDKLPPELRTQGPEILRYRRESKVPRPKLPGPRTRLEKFDSMKNKAALQLKKRKTKLPLIFGEKHIEKQDHDNSDESQIPRSSMTLSFSMTSKTCVDQGWIVHPSQSKDPEGFTLLQWANTRLQEAMRQREESHLTAKLRGEDGPLVIKYYSDQNVRSFRGGRHLRHSSFPLPTILSKLPPSLATFSSPSQHEVFLGDAQVLCLMLLPDGAGFCNYYSGHRALSFNRKGDGSKGVYVIVFDDNDHNNMIAYFMPTGHAACYHRNGGIHMLADPEGGLLMDEDGFIIRQWSWPTMGERMSQSISIQLNTHVALQCTGRSQMTLKFSCHGQMHRFPVGLTPESMGIEHGNETFWMKRSDVISNTLQTGFQFQSQAAKMAMLYSNDDTDGFSSKMSVCSFSKSQSREAISQEGGLRGRGESGKGVSEDVLMESIAGSVSKWDGESINKDLEHYRNKIKTIVSDWLGHYRQIIGISPPSRPSLQSSTSNLRLFSSSQGLRTRPPTRNSSRSHSHLHSHPLSASIPSTVPSSFTPTGSRAATPMELGDTSFYSRPISPLAGFIERPKSHSHPRPFKVDPAKPQPRPPVRFKPGCPIALHDMIVRNLKEMPQCRCDKRCITLIRDVEYDVFMKSHVPNEQLIIVCVTSSSDTKSFPCQPLLASLHEKQNRNRYSPCQQSVNDMFRIMKYDISHASDNLNINVPLLVERHHVIDGMFLMYMGNRLLGGCTGFNGYGTTKRDFLRQVQRSIENGRKGQYLPLDFKFSVSGMKIHSHKLWAYSVSGVTDEFISQTPSSSHSSPNNSLTSIARVSSGHKLYISSCVDIMDSSPSETSDLSSSKDHNDFKRED